MIGNQPDRQDPYLFTTIAPPNQHLLRTDIAPPGVATRHPNEHIVMVLDGSG
jgi:hypothetical protein